MSCCCPPAISALFCLWARSGFSKSSVAGALTFFPPDPPLYKFAKVVPQAPPPTTHTTSQSASQSCEPQKAKESKRGDHESEPVANEDPCKEENAAQHEQNSISEIQGGTTSSLPSAGVQEPLLQSTEFSSKVATASGATNAMATATAATHTNTPKVKKRPSTPPPPPLPPQDTMEPNVHPAVALTQRALQLRQEAKKRNRQDAMDASMGVTYTFHPDPRLAPPPGYSGSIEAVKIPHLVERSSRRISSCRDTDDNDHENENINHVACVIYRMREDRVTEQTKTIIYSHGNATDIGAMHFMQVVIAKGLRCNVVMYDYSGYGESGGVPLEENTYKDIEAVYQYVLDHVVTDGNERNIVLYGQSVGGGPSCYLAAKKKDVGGLILHSAFMSGMRVLTPSRALGCLDIFPNITRIQRVQCPVMVIHGMMDEEVGFEHGVALHEAVPDDCKRNPWWVRDRGHNDITDGRQKILEYIQKLKIFLDSLEND